jgi:hypothetical protein
MNPAHGCGQIRIGKIELIDQEFIHLFLKG